MLFVHRTIPCFPLPCVPSVCLKNVPGRIKVFVSDTTESPIVLEEECNVRLFKIAPFLLEPVSLRSV